MKAHYELFRKPKGGVYHLIEEKTVDFQRTMYYIAKEVEKKITGRKRTLNLWIRNGDKCSDLYHEYKFDKQKFGISTDYLLIIKRV